VRGFLRKLLQMTARGGVSGSSNSRISHVTPIFLEHIMSSFMLLISLLVLEILHYIYTSSSDRSEAPGALSKNYNKKGKKQGVNKKKGKKNVVGWHLSQHVVYITEGYSLSQQLCKKNERYSKNKMRHHTKLYDENIEEKVTSPQGQNNNILFYLIRQLGQKECMIVCYINKKKERVKNR
ncbi:hypothetical protein ACJX0J_030631, partial [Zea mays]